VSGNIRGLIANGYLKLSLIPARRWWGQPPPLPQTKQLVQHFHPKKSQTCVEMESSKLIIYFTNIVSKWPKVLQYV
jgi:hypothetical protein